MKEVLYIPVLERCLLLQRLNTNQCNAEYTCHALSTAQMTIKQTGQDNYTCVTVIYCVLQVPDNHNYLRPQIANTYKKRKAQQFSEAVIFIDQTAASLDGSVQDISSNDFVQIDFDTALLQSVMPSVQVFTGWQGHQ